MSKALAMCMLPCAAALSNYAVTQDTLTDDGLEPRSGIATRKLRVTYPTNASKGATFPVIVYAHGAAGGGVDMTGYDKHFKDMAAHGFVVIAPMSCDIGCKVKGPAKNNSVGAPEYCYKAWPSFTYENTRALDYAKNATSSGAVWAGLIDWTAGVGTAGHSMGGEAVVGMASRDVAQQYNVKAAVCLHCLACINTGDLVATPAIYFTGTLDTEVSPKKVKKAYEADTVTPKTYRNQKGKGHLEMLNLEVQYNAAISLQTAAFMKVYLAGDHGDYYDIVYGTGASSVCGYAAMKECEHTMQ